MVLLLCAAPLMPASPKKAAIRFNPDIVYAQAILETGHFKSKVCKDCNNLFGLYDSRNKRYYKFDKWHYSIKAYKTMIQSKYKPPDNYHKF